MTPSTPDEVAAALRRAADARQTIAIRGAGTKSDWGRDGARADAILDMRSLNRVLAHEAGDMTATLEAGAALADVNRALAPHRQWLPLDPPFAERATIGGVLATNDSGPLRHRYGTPRDLVIGVQLATTDGVLSKAGGRVVKNVAGYDLGKLMSGSFGSLAAIVTATFKLAPLPAATASVVARFRGGEQVARAAAAVSASQLEPAAFDLHVEGVGRPLSDRSVSDPRYRLLIQFASTQAAIDAQVDQVRRLLAADSFELVTGDEERDGWRRHARGIWAAPGLIVRASWLPASLAALLTLLNEVTGRDPAAIELVGRAGVGAGLIRIETD